MADDKRYFPRPRIAERLSPRFGWDWEYIGSMQLPEAIRSISGSMMKHCYVVRDRATWHLELVGTGELRKYCEVEIEFSPHVRAMMEESIGEHMKKWEAKLRTAMENPVVDASGRRYFVIREHS